MARLAIHPGEHLAEELGALGMSAAELARRLEVPTNRITAIRNGQRAITGDTALRLGHWWQIRDLFVAESKFGITGFPSGLCVARRRPCRGADVPTVIVSPRFIAGDESFSAAGW